MAELVVVEVVSHPALRKATPTKIAGDGAHFIYRFWLRAKPGKYTGFIKQLGYTSHGYLRNLLPDL
jgi:hypothetical protein